MGHSAIVIVPMANGRGAVFRPNYGGRQFAVLSFIVTSNVLMGILCSICYFGSSGVDLLSHALLFWIFKAIHELESGKVFGIYYPLHDQCPLLNRDREAMISTNVS